MAVLNVAATEDALAEQVARRFVDVVNEAVRMQGPAAVCLTGGTTPKRLYQLLASAGWRDAVAWDRVHLYWTDERCVPPDHPDSNYGMARDALISHVPVPPSHVHRIRGELTPAEAAQRYERELPEEFDLMLLGLGADAHIASIFPGSPLVEERTTRVADVWVPHLESHRVTLTPPPILSGAHIVMLVAGSAKAAAVAAAIEAPDDPSRVPAHLLRAADDRVEWFIDAGAAQALTAPRG